MTATSNDAHYSALRNRIRSELRTLPDKPDETPEATLNCLWALAAGQHLAVSQARGFSTPALDAAGLERLTALVEQRLANVPLAHLTGRQDFMGLIMLASPAALIPRKETEILGRAAVAVLENLDRQNPLVIDVCTGAGNVALGIAHNVPAARVLGADVSADAVDLARRNAAFLGLDEVEFRCGDFLEPFRNEEFLGKVDVLTCNPPYISSKRVPTMPEEISQHEPQLAFDGGPFGVRLFRRLVKEAPDFLEPGGWLLFEIGVGQGPATARGLERDPRYDIVNTHGDANGEIRVIEARRA